MVVDEQLATFVVNSHMRSHPEFCEDDGEGQTDEDSLGSGGASGGAVGQRAWTSMCS